MQALFLLVVPFLATVIGQPIPGCPTRGCRPTGSFSFQMDVPSTMRVAWSRIISEGETVHSDLGCVGNSYTLLCPVINETFRSFVSLDPLTGKTRWTEKNLNDPPLPLMDIYGRIIAFDGQVLTMILSNGTVVPPVEKFEINMRPTYSLVVADDSLFVMVDSTGFLCSYDADGIIHASVWLNRTDEGAYAAIATPVISGIRAYILTQWKPFKNSHEVSEQYRLWAIDIRPRTPPYMNTVWMYDFKTPDDNQNTWSEPRDAESVQPRVVTHKTMIENSNMVYVTLSHNSKTMWLIQDKGNSYELVTSLTSNVVSMSINDNPTQEKHYMKNKREGEGPNKKKVTKSKLLEELGYTDRLTGPYENEVLKQNVSPNNDPTSLPNMWIVLRFSAGGKHPATDELMMVDPRSGETLFNPMLMDLFNASVVRVTSEVMVVTPSESEDYQTFPPTVILAVNITQNSSTPAVNYIVSIQKSGEMGKLLWSIPVPGNFEVKGQIAGISTQDKKHVLVAYSHKYGAGGQVVGLTSDTF